MAVSEDWQVVEEALNLRMVIAGRPEGDVKMAEAQIALDRLREREAGLESDLEHQSDRRKVWRDLSDEYLARAEAAERDRDEWKAQHVRDAFKAQAAEARVARLEEALREIADTEWGDVTHETNEPNEVARRTLAHEEEA